MGTPLLGAGSLPLLATLEQDWGLAAYFTWRGEIPPPEEVLVIAIDERSSRLLEQPDRRARHARLIDTLSQAGASLIVLDLFLDEPSAHDAELGRAVARAGNVILTTYLERDGSEDMLRARAIGGDIGARALATAPWIVPEAFRVDWVFQRWDTDRYTVPAVALHGYAYDDLTAFLRRIRPDLTLSVERGLNGPDLSSAMSSLMRLLQRLVREDREFVAALRDAARLDPRLSAVLRVYARDPPSQASRVFVNYYGRPRTLPTLAYDDALDGELPELAGKAVFVGFSATRQPGQRDDYPYVYSRDGFNLSGVELSATVFGNLLHDQTLVQPPWLVRTLIVAFWGLLIAACLTLLRVRQGLAAGLALCVSYAAGATWFFAAHSLWLPLVTPGAQFLFAVGVSLRVKHLRDRVRLGAGTTEEAALALTGRGKLAQTDLRVILHADQQGSKAWLKHLRAALEDHDIHRLQTELAVARDEPIRMHGGRINHLLADSLLAHWPLSTATSPDPAVVSACRAALDMQAGIDAFNAKHPTHATAMRIGLDAGRISSGLNPSPLIKDWKMDGRAIHAAERLESLNKVLGTTVLVSAAVASKLDEGEFFVPWIGVFAFSDERDEIVVDPISVHVLAAAPSVSDRTRRAATRYAAALTAARSQDWRAAAAALQGIEGHLVHQSLLDAYRSWCQLSAKDQADWHGVVRVKVADKSQILQRHLA